MRFTCLIITFNPPPEVFPRQLEALADESVIIVDNGSSPDFMDQLQAWQKARPALRRVIALGENRGIAAAQNTGMRLARERGYDFVLLLDHDSVPSPGLPASLYQAARSTLGRGERLAAVGARIVDPRRNVEHGFHWLHNGVWSAKRCEKQDGSLIPCEFLNASGSLIYVPAWEDIGGFDEDFFIDHVETDWYMRARAKGYRVYGLCEGQLEHYLGDDVVRWWLLSWRTMPRRSPGRHYTIVRNSLWMWRRDYVPLSFKLNNLLKLVFTLVFFSLFDTEGSAQLRHILKGFWDGLLKYPSNP
ncbi:glycosyltransferase family 2 protein [Methylomagnum sp.]